MSDKTKMVSNLDTPAFIRAATELARACRGEGFTDDDVREIAVMLFNAMESISPDADESALLAGNLEYGFDLAIRELGGAS